MTFVLGRESPRPRTGGDGREESAGKKLTRAVALKRNAVVTQTMKKPGKTRISEEDWNRYVDAILKKNLWGHGNQAITDKEMDNDKN